MLRGKIEGLHHIVYFYDLYFECFYHLQCFITNVQHNTLMDKAQKKRKAYVPQSHSEVNNSIIQL